MPRDLWNVKMAAPVLVVTGMRFEARVAAGIGVQVICRQNAGLAPDLEKRLAHACPGIVSFGVAGGLTDALRPGDWMIANSVMDGTHRIACDVPWSDALRRALPSAHGVEMIGMSAPVMGAGARHALHAATGAAAVDMESHIVARMAHARRIPFVCCRVVVDPVERPLPPAVLAAIRGDGSTDVLAVLRSMVARPGQMPALFALARDAWIAQRALARGRLRIGDGFGRYALPDMLDR